MTYPIVLAHGICRFDIVARAILDDEEQSDDRTHYFRCIRSTLQANGFTAYHSAVPWAKSVSVRATALKANVEEVLRKEQCPKAHIIAHSMGGLDARHMLFEHQADKMHEKVASVSTIGTPHLGTTFADWGVTNATAALAVLKLLQITEIDGFKDLTTWVCQAFNQRAEAFERTCGVTFQTFAGTQDLPFIFEPLKFSWALIHFHEGANDGLASLKSARWRDDYFRREINADHLNEVGWWDPNDHGLRLFPEVAAGSETRREMETRIRSFYVGIAQELARQFP